MHKAKRYCCDGNSCIVQICIIFTCVAIIKKQMCLVRHISNNSTQEAMEESHVQSIGRACMKTLLCRNKACSCYSPTVYIYNKCHALLYKLLYRHTKLQHSLILRILYYCTFSSLNLLETTAFVYNEKRETEGLKNSIRMTLPKDNSLL